MDSVTIKKHALYTLLICAVMSVHKAGVVRVGLLCTSQLEPRHLGTRGWLGL